MRNITVASGGHQSMIGFQSVLRRPPVERKTPPAARAFVGAVAGYLRAEREHFIPERGMRFLPNSHYVSNRSRGFGVRIGSMDERFKSTLLGRRGVIEGPRPARCLVSSRVTKRISAKDLIHFFGEDRVVTALSDAHALMLQQVRCVPSEILLGDRYPNVFVVRDDKGALHAVPVRFCEDGWNLSIPEDSLRYEWSRARIFLPAPV